MSIKKFLVFYSWQSDLPETRYFIQAALKNAADAVMKGRSGVDVVVDQATRDLPGAPNIPMAIMTKIKEADMVICDITTINPDAKERRSPNPNVVFELGFSVALLGWARVALMFDESVGSFPGDMPFDFDRHRASPFNSGADPKPPELKKLSRLLQTAIEFTIDKNPARPTATLTPEQIRHEQDAIQLEWVMSSIHIPTIDDHVMGMPYSLSDKAIHVWEGLNGIVSGSYFYLHDQELFDLIKKFHRSFGQTLDHDEMYHDTPSGRMYVFTGHDGMFSKRQGKVWEEIKVARDEMAATFRELLGRVRTQYLEVDLQETNREAWKTIKSISICHQATSNERGGGCERVVD